MHAAVAATGQLYLHIRVVLGIILGLGITTLLKGVASIIEHPGRHQWSWVHMSWVSWALVSIVTYWWWEFRLSEVKVWTFESYLFVIGYCSLYFMVSTLLFPDDVSDYGRYEPYLIQRRAWFFGLIALITLLDLVDTSLKGPARWQALGISYPIHAAAMLVIAGLGATIANRRTQLAVAIGALAYQIVYFTLQYFTVTTA